MASEDLVEFDRRSRNRRLETRLSDTANYAGPNDGNERLAGGEEQLGAVPPAGVTPYCSFPYNIKALIIGMATFSSFISPLSLNIYFPALTPLAMDLDVSVSLINLSITSYQIVQAVAPMFVGDFGDTAGRRPAFIISFIVYCGANVGLAIQTNYIALVVLRCLQSLGGSGTLALCYGVVADVSTTAERGKYMGIVGMGMMAGPALGLLIGGILAQYLTWRSVFWFCFIITALWLVPYILVVPETCRTVVGNGSTTPPAGWNMTMVDLFRSRKSHMSGEKSSGDHASANKRMQWPNPLRTLVIWTHKDMSMLLLFNAMVFTAIFMALTILSTSFVDIYGLNQLQIGLCYLPYGVACGLTTLVQGRILDWNYRRLANRIGFAIDKRGGDDLRHYPIELCRLQLAAPVIATGVVALIGYGWTLEARANLGAPLAMLFLIGLGLVGGHSILNTLIVDLYPQSPATGIAANNLGRCLLSAGGSAVVKLLVQAIGYGWCFTLVGSLLAVFSPLLYLLVIWGPKWREQRRVEVEQGRGGERTP
ncbi:MFS transporter [Diaporthe helianthi]|uniref:MFS transporter n=1 Tax=Diaporthe helianthi TaxID=158607 RepID=A0A2P5HUT3_DIAHE|nr:MFS transporter [Diaporthe helianthi]